MNSWLIVVAILPWIVALGLSGLRTPAWLLSAYAVIVPFGSSISVPAGLPAHFSTSTTLMGLVATGGLLLNLVSVDARARELPRPLPWWVLFFCATTATLAWSITPLETLNQLLVLASLLGLYVVANLIRVRWKDVRILEAGIALSGAITGAYAMFQLFAGRLDATGDGIPRFETAGGGGEGGDPNITAATLILPLAVSLARGMSARSVATRVGYLTAAALSGGAIMLTGSRGGLLAVLVTVFVLAFDDRRRVARIVYVFVPILAVAVTFAAAGEALQERVQSGGSSGRTLIWRMGLQACDEYCWRGSGWGSFPEVFREEFLGEPDTNRVRSEIGPHSIWLQAPVEAGWFALVALVGALVSTARELWRLPIGLRAPPLAAFAGLLFANSLVANLDFKYFWLVLIYCAWMVSAQNEEPLAADEVDELPSRGAVTAV